MRKRRNYTRADVKYLLSAVEAAGKQVAYVKHCSDDSGFRVVCREVKSNDASSEPANEWDEVLPNASEAT